MRCLALYARSQAWTWDSVRSMPLRQWRWLPAAFEAVAAMADESRPGNKPAAPGNGSVVVIPVGDVR